MEEWWEFNKYFEFFRLWCIFRRPKRYIQFLNNGFVEIRGFLDVVTTGQLYFLDSWKIYGWRKNYSGMSIFTASVFEPIDKEIVKKKK